MKLNHFCSSSFDLSNDLVRSWDDCNAADSMSVSSHVKCRDTDLIGIDLDTNPMLK